VSSKKSTPVSVENGQRYSWQRQFRKCAKQCRTCQEQSGHGPYWYKYWREGGKVKSEYVGKRIPTGTKFLEGEEEAPTTEAFNQMTTAPPQSSVMPPRKKQGNRRKKHPASNTAREASQAIPIAAPQVLAL
jgi:hypothetical protein